MKFKPRLFGVSLALGIALGARCGNRRLHLPSGGLRTLSWRYPDVLVFRVTVVALLLIFGFVVSQVLYRQEMTEREAA